jgi:metallo-beta-lactamase family protein
MKIHFLGGVDTVTGSQHLLETRSSRALRDCGLYQGRRDEARAINRQFAFNPPALQAVVLSHAHIDHCGNLPSLTRAGYRGPIHATTATASLCGIMLRDSAHIQEQDAAYLNQKTSRRNLERVEPLYTLQDAEDALGLFAGHRYGEDLEIAAGMAVRLLDAGHILGAALTVFTLRENGATRRVGFALDLGRRDLPMIRDPEIMDPVDVLVLESTYGDRLHDDATHAKERLRDVVARTLARGGRIFIPSFALERAQEIIYHLASLFSEGQLPRVPVYVDSPMAGAVAAEFERNADYLDAEYRQLRERIGCVMRCEWVTYVRSVEESKAVTASRDPCIVIAASGMCEHGRILHHLKHGIENPANTVVIVGFQAQRTLGRRLINGDAEVRIFGDWFKRRAEVVPINAFSAHADRNDLVDYVRRVKPARTFLVHGESDQRAALAEALRGVKGTEVHRPARGDVVEL